MSERDNARSTRAIQKTLAWLGSFPAILMSLALVAAWGVLGPFMGFSDTWQLLINTPTTVVTFWMAFVILNAQNRDARALQTKLDLIIKAQGLGEDVVGLEDQPEKDIEQVQQQVREG
jgi:low affinity Fe/Cu permease